MATTAIQQTFSFGQSDSSAPASSAPALDAPPVPPTDAPTVCEPGRANTQPAALAEPWAPPAHRRAPAESGSRDSSPPPPPSDRAAVLRRLRAEVGCVTSGPAEPTETISSGCAVIDESLPQQGLRLDSLTEWVADSEASGAATLALAAAAEHLRSPRGAGPLVVVDGGGTFHPPAAVSLGIPAERIIWCRPSRHADLVWSIDQALRCESVAAVFAHVGLGLDDRDARRFQLAAETGRTPGLLVRPAAARGKPTFAETRFHVAAEPLPAAAEGPIATDSAPAATDWMLQSGRTMRVTLDRTRGPGRGQHVTVAIDDRGKIYPVSAAADVPSVPFPPSAERLRHETVAVHLASQLADPASLRAADRRRRRGA